MMKNRNLFPVWLAARPRDRKEKIPAPGLFAGTIRIVILLLAAASWASAQSLLDQAREALNSGQPRQALRLLDQLKQQDPGKSLPYLYSLKALLQDGRKQDAASELVFMPAPDDLSAEQVFELARVLVELGRREQAVELLQAVAASLSTPPEALWDLSEQLRELKRFDDALVALRSYARRVPGDARIRLREGELLLLAGQLEPALTALEDVVQAHPDDPRGYYEMARTLRFGNNPQAAKRIIAQAVEKKGPDPDYLHLQGLIAADLGEFQEAVGFLEKASRLEGASSRIYFDLGNAQRNLGNREESRQALARYQELFREEEAAKNRGQSIEQLVNQGSQQLASGNAGAARSSFLRALELDPAQYQARVQLIQIYLSSGTPVEAGRELDRLRQTSDDCATTRFLAAYLAYQQQDLPAAALEAEKARDYHPGNPELRNLLGNIYFALGKQKEALGEYQAAMRLAPDQLAYRANYQTLARRLGVP